MRGLPLIDIGAIWRLSLAKFGVFVDEGHGKLPTLYWLHKLYKRKYKSHFIANSNSSSCNPTGLSILLTSCLTAIKNHIVDIVKQFMRGMVKSFLTILIY